MLVEKVTADLMHHNIRLYDARLNPTVANETQNHVSMTRRCVGIGLHQMLFSAVQYSILHIAPQTNDCVGHASFKSFLHRAGQLVPTAVDNDHIRIVAQGHSLSRGILLRISPSSRFTVAVHAANAVPLKSRFSFDCTDIFAQRSSESGLHRYHFLPLMVASLATVQ